MLPEEGLLVFPLFTCSKLFSRLFFVLFRDAGLVGSVVVATALGDEAVVGAVAS